MKRGRVEDDTRMGVQRIVEESFYMLHPMTHKEKRRSFGLATRRLDELKRQYGAMTTSDECNERV